MDNPYIPRTSSPLNPQAVPRVKSTGQIPQQQQKLTQRRATVQATVPVAIGTVVKRFPIPEVIPNAQSDKLPTLPVPSLDNTIATYLQTVRPFLNDEDYAHTEQVCQEFREKDGPKLQKRLEERKKEADDLGPFGFRGELVRDEKTGIVSVTRNSWMIDWWNEYSYCAYREPLVINVSYFFVFPDDARTKIKPHPASLADAKVGVNSSLFKGTWGGSTGTDQFDLQCERASRLVIGAMEFRRLLMTGKLALESSNPKDTNAPPLCMHQYRYMFNASRIPAVPSDYVATFPSVENEHLCVMRKNQFFVVQMVVDDEYEEAGQTLKGRRRISADELAKQLRWIIDNAGTASAIPLGTMSCMPRDPMSVARTLLLSCPDQPTPQHNSHLMHILESSTMLLCLDDTSPVTREEVSRNMWHGDGQNRWFDKSIQIVVCENGKAGLVGEHSMMDATPNTHCWNWVLDGLKAKNISMETGQSLQDALDDVKHNGWKMGGLSKPEKLDFYIPSALLPTLASTLSSFTDVVARHDLQVLDFKPYGKDLIKTFKCSPDAWCQMAIQLAYFRLFGIMVATYESAGMRRYAWGRTETCRSVCNQDIVKFIEGWCGQDSEDLDVLTKVSLCRSACQAQSGYMAQCQKGNGIDRHLLGLRLCLYPGEEVPALYLDPAYTLTSHWTLSTSQVPSENFAGYGWDSVCPDGFGVAYMVRNKNLFFNVAGLVRIPGETPGKEANGTEMKTNRVQRFRHLLEESLHEMREVFEQAMEIESKQVRDQVKTPLEELKSPIARPPVSSFFSTDAVVAAGMTAEGADLGFHTRTISRRRNSMVPEMLRPPTPLQHIETAATSGITTESLGLSLAYPPRTVLGEMVINEQDGQLEGLAYQEFVDAPSRKDSPVLRPTNSFVSGKIGPVEEEGVEEKSSISYLTKRLLSWWGKE